MKDEINIPDLSNEIVREFESLPEFVASARSVKEAIKAADGIFKKAFAGAKAAAAVISDVINHVEEIGAVLEMAGAQKRALAVSVINTLVDIPLLPESGEAALIGFMVDLVVAAYNQQSKRKNGCKWTA